MIEPLRYLKRLGNAATLLILGIIATVATSNGTPGQVTVVGPNFAFSIMSANQRLAAQRVNEKIYWQGVSINAAGRKMMVNYSTVGAVGKGAFAGYTSAHKSGGHTIRNAIGTAMPTRTFLRYSSPLQTIDDPVNNETRASVPVATTTTAGLMGAVDKTKLDGYTNFAATYGADPTGVIYSDSAWAAFVSSGSNNLYIPKGSYKFHSEASISNRPLSIKGDGASSTILTWDATSTNPGIHILENMWSYSVDISSLSLLLDRVGTYNSDTALSIDYSASSVDANKKGWISDVYIDGSDMAGAKMWGKGIYLRDLSGFTVNNVKIKSAYGDGIEVYGSNTPVDYLHYATEININNPFMLGIRGKAINVHGYWEGVVINGGSIAFAHDGIWMDGTGHPIETPEAHIIGTHVNASHYSVMLKNLFSASLNSSTIFSQSWSTNVVDGTSAGLYIDGVQELNVGAHFYQMDTGTTKGKGVWLANNTSTENVKLSNAHFENYSTGVHSDMDVTGKNVQVSNVTYVNCDKNSDLVGSINNLTIVNTSTTSSVSISGQGTSSTTIAVSANTTNDDASVFAVRKFNGTTPLGDGATIGAFQFTASNGPSFGLNSQIISHTVGTQSATNAGGVLSFQTTPNGAIVPQDSLIIHDTGTIEAIRGPYKFQDGTTQSTAATSESTTSILSKIAGNSDSQSLTIQQGAVTDTSNTVKFCVKNYPAGTCTASITSAGTLTATAITAPGSTGSIPFNGGAALSTDSNLYWDNTNKRFGVGTATPSVGLHTKGSSIAFRSERTSTTATNTIAAVAQFEMTTTQTSTDGFGPGFNFLLTDAGATDQFLGSIAAVRAGAVNTGDIILRPSVAGAATERFRVTSYGTVRLSLLSSAPSSPVEADCYYDSTLHKLRCYDGTTWQNAW